METWTNSTTTSAVYAYPMTITSGGVYIQPATPPRPQTPLEWLDSEIEKTCAIARRTS